MTDTPMRITMRRVADRGGGRLRMEYELELGV